MSPEEAPQPPPCPHRPPCPGCPRYGESSPPDQALRALADLAESAGLSSPEIHSTGGLGHRHRARLAIRGRSASPKIGLFQEGSHRIADTPNCAVHHPAINATVMHLKSAIRASGVEPYADKPHRGALRYVQIVVERRSSRVQVVLVGNGTSPDVLRDLPERFVRALGDRLQGLFFNAQPERSNAILGPETERLAGADAIVESIAGVDVFYPPAAFGQNHLPLFEQAAARIAALVPRGANVAELYCGVGAIGLGLLARGEHVSFNERSPAGLAGLQLGLAALPAEARGRARVAPGAAEDCLGILDNRGGDQPRAEGAPRARDVVILDPPRKGLDGTLVEALVAKPPARVIYLACGLPSLLRDLDRLRAEDRFVLSGIELYDFFPFTKHVETLVWLDRNAEHFDSTRPNTDSRTHSPTE